MEIISGEFVMRGCDRSEAFCSIEDAVSLIHQIGFLPLFSNEISGFSVEEHVPADVWWTGDSHTDPWEWRMILAEDQSIAYGKFFSRAAGFVSKDFFPLFANYRRNGYEFGGVIGYLCLLDKAQKRIPYDAYTARVSNTAQGGMKAHKSRLS